MSRTHGDEQASPPVPPNPFEPLATANDHEARYLVKEASLPIGYDYVVEDDQGDVAFKVDGKLLRIRETLIVNDAAGREILAIRGTLLGVKEVLNISRDDTTIATVRKARPEPGRDEYFAEVPRKDRIEVIGNPAEHAYSLNYQGYTIATTSRPRLSLGGGYHVNVAIGQDHGVLLAITVCLDVMSRS
jgi:uncharacterized protein YxjI